MHFGLEHYLILSAVMFSIGLYGALAKRNAVAILMCIEIMLNAVNIALVAFSRYLVPNSCAAYRTGICHLHHNCGCCRGSGGSGDNNRYLPQPSECRCGTGRFYEGITRRERL